MSASRLWSILCVMANPDNSLIGELDSAARETRPDDRSRAADSARDSATAAWWRGAVIYQIYPRSFADANGDGVGDLKGAAAKLDHVASLGVDAVWLSPFFPSPMKDFGYDVADYCDVDPMFGDLKDFDDFLAKAHALGLKVVIDQVYSHTSDQHAWFAESRQDRTNPKADWYVWADPKPDGTPPNNWQSVFGGGAWEWDARRRQYYFHNFLASQPDLNLHNSDVQDAVLAAGRFWLDRGVDGFRLDAINFALHDPELKDNPPRRIFDKPPTRPFDFQERVNNMSQPGVVDFLERVRALTDEYDGRFTVAEVGGLDSIDEMRAFTEGENRLNTAYSFNFLYADELTPALVRGCSRDWPDAPGAGWPSWAFSNHDAPRAVSRWAKGLDPQGYAKMTLLLLMAMRGNAFLYQGEELGLPQADVPFDRLRDPEAIANWPLTLGRDGARTPFPWSSEALHAGFSNSPDETWLPADPRHAALAVDRQEREPDSTLSFARAAIALRKGSPALSRGEIEFLSSPDGVLAFERRCGAERMLCVFNLSERQADWRPADHAAWRIALFAGGDPRMAESGLLRPGAGYIAELI